MRQGETTMIIAILDDEEVYRNQIETLIKQHFPKDTVLTYPTVMALLSSHSDVDLLLLDIEMPQMDGLTFAKTYEERFPNIIYITTHDELVYDAFGRNILGFIKKSDLEEKLTEKLNEYLASNTPTLTIQTEFDELTIPIHQIIYFYYEAFTVLMVTKKQAIKLKYRSLKQVQILLDPALFCPIDRNTIINVTQISHFIKARKEIEMSNHNLLSVSKRNWKPLLQTYHRGLLK